MQPAGDDFMPRQDVDSRDSTTYLAEDRTFLAWIRTGIALMGFGFVVARFGLFLRELEATQSGSPAETTAFSVVLGTALIVCGVLVTILASFKYMRRLRDLRQGVRTMGKPSKLALFVAIALSAAGLAMAVYIGTQKAATHFPSAAGKAVRAIEPGNETR
jgi:putative membrane protein